MCADILCCLLFDVPNFMAVLQGTAYHWAHTLYCDWEHGTCNLNNVMIFSQKVITPKTYWIYCSAKKIIFRRSLWYKIMIILNQKKSLGLLFSPTIETTVPTGGNSICGTLYTSFDNVLQGLITLLAKELFPVSNHNTLSYLKILVVLSQEVVILHLCNNVLYSWKLIVYFQLILN